eukprot:8486067-Pyramimonas_sp.AAC.1
MCAGVHFCCGVMPGPSQGRRALLHRHVRGAHGRAAPWSLATRRPGLRPVISFLGRGAELHRRGAPRRPAQLEADGWLYA